MASVLAGLSRFFRSVRLAVVLILVIVALVGGAGFGIYELTKKEEEASPIR